MNPKLPTIKGVAALLHALKADIGDEYRAEGCKGEPTPSMTVTIGADGTSAEFGFQTGDNSFSGGAYGYPYWGVVILTRRSNCRELARDAIEQIYDQIED